MKSSSLFYLTILCVATVAGKDLNNTTCDHLGIRFYEDINCQPVISNVTNCPEYYKCPNYTVESEKCAHKGVMYKTGERIITNTTYKDKCVCYENYRNAQMQVRCPLMYCMRFTNNECYQKFSLEEDCSIGEICPPFLNETTCTVDGQTFREGEIFRPMGTCWKCLCQSGYNGTFEEPFCIREPCHTELFHFSKIAKLCLPVYHLFSKDEAPCCPNKFVCPNEIMNLELISEAAYDEVVGDETCLIGDWEIKLGTVFNMTYTFEQVRQHVICSCRVPPLPGCYSTVY